MGTAVVPCRYPEGSCDLTFTGAHVNNGEQEECEACGARDELSVHHIVPREDGGSNDASNLITLCDPNDKGMDRTLGCHWIVGHGAAGWAKSNPHCRNQSAALLKRSKAKEVAELPEHPGY